MISFRRIILLAVAGTGLGWAGYALPSSQPQALQGKAATEKQETASAPKILYYRAPMGDATSPAPAKDSMGMDYVPVYAGPTGESPGTVTLTAERIQQLGVKTSTVTRHDLTRTVHAVGTVQIDEARQTVVSPRFDGWIEKLYADATGMQVRKGDPLFEFYSPELTHIEAEYPFSHELNIHNAVNGTIEKLKSLAAPQEEIDRLERQHTVNYHMTMYAPADGVILRKMAVEGMKFAPGMNLYNIADLSSVWVIADVYEQDLARVAVGQAAEITFTAYPGKVFGGKVSLIYPDINKVTRTAKVRVVLSNLTGELRLDMYADVNIQGEPEKNVLAVPASAVLYGGRQQVVLLALGGGRFKPQTVKTGARAGDDVEILDGLKEGDHVVTSANFLIDSESNLRAALQGFSAPMEMNMEKKQ